MRRSKCATGHKPTLTLVHVLGEPVDDSPGRRDIEEGHRREQDPLEHHVVQLRRPGQQPDGQRHGLDDAQDHHDDQADAKYQLENDD